MRLGEGKGLTLLPKVAQQVKRHSSEVKPEVSKPKPNLFTVS